MAKSRRQIGGRIWNADVQKVKQNVSRANRAATEILNLINRNRNMPYVAAISLYLTSITASLNNILEALDSLETTADDYKDIEVSQVWNEAFDEHSD